MSRNSKNPPGRGIRRPKRKAQDPEALQRFVDEGDARAALPTATNIQDISNIRNIQDVQNVSDVRDVRGVQDVQPLPKEAKTSPSLSEKASYVERADGRTLKRTTVYLKPDVHQRLKVAARVSGQDGSAIINTLLESHLEAIISDALQSLSR